MKKIFLENISLNSFKVKWSPGSIVYDCKYNLSKLSIVGVLLTVSLIGITPSLSLAQSFTVFMSADFSVTEGIGGFAWATGSQVALEIDNGNNGSVDYTTTKGLDTDGVVRFWPSESYFAVQQGDLVRLYDDQTPQTVKEHIVDYLTLENLSYSDDTLGGQAAPGKNLYVMIYEPSPGPTLEVVADASGAWSADYSGTFDLVPGIKGFVQTWDGDGGHTQINFGSAAFLTYANVWLEKRRFDSSYWAMDDQSFMFSWARVNYQGSATNGSDNPVVLNSTPTGTITMNYLGSWTPTDEAFYYPIEHGGDIASMETSYEFSIDSVPGSAVTREISPGSYNPLFEFVAPTVIGSSLSWSAVDGAEGYRVRFWNLNPDGTIDTSTILYSSEFLTDTQYIIPDYYHIGKYALSIEAIDLIGGDIINRTRYYTVTEATEGEVTYVAIDIKPGSDRNPVNTKSKGVTPVAILGSASFDVLNVEVNTIRFGPATIQAPCYHIVDTNDDGFEDLVTHIVTADIGLAIVKDEVCLSGNLNGGELIYGCDSIETVK